MARKRKRGPTMTREERERYDARTRLLEERIARGFAQIEGKSSSWREHAEANVAELHRQVERGAPRRDTS